MLKEELKTISMMILYMMMLFTQMIVKSFVLEATSD